MDATELATRLIGSGKPVTEARVRKVLRHLISPENFEAMLREIPDNVQREQVRALAAPLVRRRFQR